MLNFISKEPVFFVGLIQAVIVAGLNLALSFGVTLTGDQVATVNGFVVALLALTLSLVARKKVTPTNKL